MYTAALVGCGVIGSRLADAFAEHDRTRLVAVCDLDADRAAEMAAEYDTPEDPAGSCAAYTDFGAMFDAEAIDVVHVGVPPVVHAPVVEAALEAGCNVICEKPIAQNAAVGRNLVELAESSELVTAINFPFRYTPGFRELVDRVDDGEIGDPRRVSLTFRFPQWPREWQDVDWLRGREQGGPIREVGSHFLFGTFELFDTISEVDAKTKFSGPEACETSVVATFEADGVPGTLDLLTGTAGSQRLRIEVEGTEGTLALTGWRTLVANRGEEDERELTDAPGSTTLDLVDAFVAELDGEGGDLVTFAEALRVQAVVDELLGIDEA